MQQGRSNEARTMLAEICSWFIDGFDTRDLSLVSRNHNVKEL